MIYNYKVLTIALNTILPVSNFQINMSATREISTVNTAKYCIFGYILIEEFISNSVLTEESVHEAYTEVRSRSVTRGNENPVLEIVIQGLQGTVIKMPECEFEEIGAAKYCIFGYILIQELISQGALTDDSVNEAYTEVRPENCGNENSVLEIVIQGMDMFKMPELD